MSIGYVGLGAMGCALARRVLLTHPLAVHDRDHSAAAALVVDRRAGTSVVPPNPTIA